MKRFIVLLVIALTSSLMFAFTSGALTMSKRTFTWEWPGDRSPQSKAAVQVISIQTRSKGLFGLGNSPSLAGSYPDPVILEGRIKYPPAEGAHAQVTVHMPRLETGSLKEGDWAGLAILGDSVVICLEKIPSEHHSTPGAESWLDAWDCSS